MVRRAGRDIICRSGTVNYLKRIQGWCPDVADMSFEDLVKAKIDLPVFRLPDGTVKPKPKADVQAAND